MQKIRIYWITQLIGWLTYFTVNFFFFYKISEKDILFHLLLIPSAILLTHVFRHFIITKKWLQTSVIYQISVSIVFSLFLALALLPGVDLLASKTRVPRALLILVVYVVLIVSVAVILQP